MWDWCQFFQSIVATFFAFVLSILAVFIVNYIRFRPFKLMKLILEDMKKKYFLCKSMNELDLNFYKICDLYLWENLIGNQFNYVKRIKRFNKIFDFYSLVEEFNSLLCKRSEIFMESLSSNTDFSNITNTIIKASDKCIIRMDEILEELKCQN